MPWGWRVSSYFLTKGIAAGLAIAVAIALLAGAGAGVGLDPLGRAARRRACSWRSPGCCWCGT